MNKKIVEVIDEIIANAINHGGDQGGAYFSDPDDLADSLNKLCKLCPDIEWEWADGRKEWVNLKMFEFPVCPKCKGVGVSIDTPFTKPIHCLHCGFSYPPNEFPDLYNHYFVEKKL